MTSPSDTPAETTGYIQVEGDPKPARSTGEWSDVWAKHDTPAAPDVGEIIAQRSKVSQRLLSAPSAPTIEAALDWMRAAASALARMTGPAFDWKAAWYALDQDNAALSTRAQAAEAEKEAMRVERDEAVKLLTDLAEQALYKGSGPIEDIMAQGATVPHAAIKAAASFLASLSLKERKDE